MHPIQKGDELVLGPKVPLQIRDMYNNNLFGRADDDRSDRESGKWRHCQYIIIVCILKGRRGVHPKFLFYSNASCNF